MIAASSSFCFCSYSSFSAFGWSSSHDTAASIFASIAFLSASGSLLLTASSRSELRTVNV